MGSTFGVFEYAGQYYFDAFYPSTGLLQNQFDSGKGVSDVLALYHMKNHVTTVACEIRWYDRAGN